MNKKVSIINSVLILLLAIGCGWWWKTHRGESVGEIVSSPIAGAKSSLPVPIIKFKSKIDIRYLGKRAWVDTLSFSPDGRYLVIVDDIGYVDGAIVVWDLVNNKEQSRFSDITGFGIGAPKPSWSLDSKYVTMSGVFWDAMTGKRVKPSDTLPEDGTK